jgi:hypothetical protein
MKSITTPLSSVLDPSRRQIQFVLSGYNKAILLNRYIDADRHA